MREILLVLFLLSIIYSKTFLIKTKEDPEGNKNTGLDYRQNPLREFIEMIKFNKKCKWRAGASESKFCRKWFRKW